MLPGQPLDPLRAVKQAPLGAQHGDCVALLADTLVERCDFGVERPRLIFDLIDHAGERDETQYKADIDDAQHGVTRELKRPSHNDSEPRHP